MGVSFGIFFWGVSGALLIKHSWRHAYFRCITRLPLCYNSCEQGKTGVEISETDSSSFLKGRQGLIEGNFMTNEP